MRRFEFRLDAVLRLREAQLESEKAGLNRLQAEEQQLRAALEKLQAERINAKAFVQELPALGIAELRSVSSFLLGTDNRAAALRQRLDEAVVAVSRQSKRVVEADRQTRLVTKLREKRLAEWHGEMDRELETIGQETWLAKFIQRKRVSKDDGTRRSISILGSIPDYSPGEDQKTDRKTLLSSNSETDK